MSPRPVYDRWRDTDGTHIPDGARVEQVDVAKEHGALRGRLGKRGEVAGRTQSYRLYVHFDGEDAPVSIRPHLLRVVPAEVLTPRTTEQIIAALRALAAEHGVDIEHPSTR